jgi:hypothetical protein
VLLFFDKIEHEGRFLHDWSLESCDFVEKDVYWMDRLRQATKRQAPLHHKRTPEHLSWILPFSFQCAIPSRDMPYATSLCQSDPTLYHCTRFSLAPIRIYPMQLFWTSPQQCTIWLTSSTLDALAKTALMTSLSTGLGLTRIFTDRLLGFFVLIPHSLVDNGRFYEVSSVNHQKQDCRASTSVGVSSHSQVTTVVC